MTEKNTPERMCAACRKHASKQNFIRVVKNSNGEIKIDNTFKESGRGAYICRDEKCIQLAEKKNVLGRALRTTINKEIYEEILNNLD